MNVTKANAFLAGPVYYDDKTFYFYYKRRISHEKNICTYDRRSFSIIS